MFVCLSGGLLVCGLRCLFLVLAGNGLGSLGSRFAVLHWCCSLFLFFCLLFSSSCFVLVWVGWVWIVSFVRLACLFDCSLHAFVCLLCLAWLYGGGHCVYDISRMIMIAMIWYSAAAAIRLFFSASHPIFLCFVCSVLFRRVRRVV